MLSNVQVEELCRKKMSIPLHGIYFKSQLKDLGKIEYGKAYIINLESEVGEDGEPNIGSHLLASRQTSYLMEKSILSTLTVMEQSILMKWKIL